MNSTGSGMGFMTRDREQGNKPSVSSKEEYFLKG
jgi:hypothetical protein